MSLSFGGGAGLKYLGTWEADINSPQILNGSGKNGTYYIVTVASLGKTISSFEDYDGSEPGTVKANCTGHGHASGDEVTISGSTNFNGACVITVIDENSFYFTDTWVSTPAETGSAETSVDGSTNFAIGDWIMFSKQAGKWQKGPGAMVAGYDTEILKNDAGILGVCSGLKWGSTSYLQMPTGGSASAVADVMRVYVADASAGHARLYVQSEAGNPIVFGDNEIDLYNAVGDNYERAHAKWDSNIFKIGTEKGGSGTVRNITITADTANIELTGGAVQANGNDIVTTATKIYEIDSLPIGWAIDGGTAPGDLSTLDATNKVRYRDFAAGADNDVFLEWQVPYGIDPTIGITFQVEGWITNATGPANSETAIFALKGASYGDSDILSGALGTPVSVTRTFLTADPLPVQNDRFVSGWSTAVTITGLAAGELVILNLKRDVSDTYEQAIGVGWLRIKYARTTQTS